MHGTAVDASTTTSLLHPDVVRKEASVAVAALADVPYSTMSRDELAGHVLGLGQLQAQVDALMAEAAAAASEACVHVAGGQQTLPAFVAANSNAEPKRVAGDRNLGEWLRRFPLFADAFRAGSISRAHVQAFRSVDNQRTHRGLVDAQHYLSVAAADLPWRDFVEVLQTWLHRADPDGDEPKAQVEKRHFNAAKRADGMVKGSFLLDPLAGDLLLNAVSQEERRQRRAAEEGDERTGGQRRSDALVALVERGATRPDGTVAAPLVHIVMGEAVAADLLMRMAVEDAVSSPLERRAALLELGLDPDELPLDPSTPEGRCHLADGTPVHPRLVVAALAAGTLRRLVLGADGEVLDLGRRVRDFPRHMKDAVIAAHKGRCVEPGCDASTDWLEADHHRPWARSGPTAIRNCQPRCMPHNRQKRDLLPP